MIEGLRPAFKKAIDRSLKIITMALAFGAGQDGDTVFSSLASCQNAAITAVF